MIPIENTVMLQVLTQPLPIHYFLSTLMGSFRILDNRSGELVYVAQVCAFSEDIRVLSSPPFTGHLSSPIPINGWSQVMVIGWAHSEAIVLCAVPGKICAKL